MRIRGYLFAVAVGSMLLTLLTELVPLRETTPAALPSESCTPLRGANVEPSLACLEPTPSPPDVSLAEVTQPGDVAGNEPDSPRMPEILRFELKAQETSTGGRAHLELEPLGCGLSLATRTATARGGRAEVGCELASDWGCPACLRVRVTGQGLQPSEMLVPYQDLDRPVSIALRRAMRIVGSVRCTDDNEMIADGRAYLYEPAFWRASGSRSCWHPCPIKSVEVRLLRSRARRRRPDREDPARPFVVEVSRPGRHLLVVSMDGYLPVSREIEVEPGESANVGSLDLVPGFTVSGRLECQGQGAKNISMGLEMDTRPESLYGQMEGFAVRGDQVARKWTRSKTDKDGRFSFGGLISSDYSVWVDDILYWGTSRRGRLECPPMVTVTAPRDGILFDLPPLSPAHTEIVDSPPPGARLKVHLRDAQGRVYARDSIGVRARGPGTTHSVTWLAMGSDSTYFATGLPGGTHHLDVTSSRFSDPSLDTWCTWDEASCELAPGEDTELELCGRTGGQALFVVRDSAHSPCRTGLRIRGRVVDMRISVSTDGWALLKHPLPAGRYQLQAWDVRFTLPPRSFDISPGRCNRVQIDLPWP